MPVINRVASSRFRVIFLVAISTTTVAAIPVMPDVEPVVERPALAPPPATPERLHRGRLLYSKHCASCHGPGGAGDGSAAHDLDPKPTDLRDPEVATKPDAKLFRQITRGRAPMPSFARLLNDDDRWTVVAYVKTLAKGESPRASR